MATPCLENMSSDIVRYIALFLPYRDIKNYFNTYPRFTTMINLDFWKRKLHKDYQLEDENPEKEYIKQTLSKIGNEVEELYELMPYSDPIIKPTYDIYIQAKKNYFKLSKEYENKKQIKINEKVREKKALKLELRLMEKGNGKVVRLFSDTKFETTTKVREFVRLNLKSKPEAKTIILIETGKAKAKRIIHTIYIYKTEKQTRMDIANGFVIPKILRLEMKKEGKSMIIINNFYGLDFTK